MQLLDLMRHGTRLLFGLCHQFLSEKNAKNFENTRFITQTKPRSIRLSKVKIKYESLSKPPFFHIKYENHGKLNVCLCLGFDDTKCIDRKPVFQVNDLEIKFYFATNEADKCF